MKKFKVGDRVIGNNRADDLYCITIKGFVGKVIKVYSEDSIRIVDEDGMQYDVRSVAFDLMEDYKNPSEPILIYRKGDSVFAVNRVTKEKAEAKCNPEDPFDFYVGAQIAFRRLLTSSRVLPQDRLEELCRGSVHVGDKVRVIEPACFTEGISSVMDLCKDHPEWMLRFAYRVPFKLDGKTYKVLAMDDQFVYITKACCEDRGACWLIRKEAVVKEV